MKVFRTVPGVLVVVLAGGPPATHGEALPNNVLPAATRAMLNDHEGMQAMVRPVPRTEEPVFNPLGEIVDDRELVALYGVPFIVTGGPYTTPDSYVQAFLNQHGGALGGGALSFGSFAQVFAHTTGDGKLKVYKFEQTGTDDSRVTVPVQLDGGGAPVRIMYVGMRGLADPAAVAALAPSSVTETEASAAVLSEYGGLTLGSGEEGVYAGDGNVRRIWKFTGSDATRTLRFYVDAHTEEIVMVDSLVDSLPGHIEGTVRANRTSGIGPNEIDGTETVVVPGAEVELLDPDCSQEAGTIDETDADDGTYEFTFQDGDIRSGVRSRLVGQHVTVSDNAGSNLEPCRDAQDQTNVSDHDLLYLGGECDNSTDACDLSGPNTCGAGACVNDPEALAQINAFLVAEETHRWFDDLVPGFGAGFGNVSINVNDPDASCSAGAYWSPSSRTITAAGACLREECHPDAGVEGLTRNWAMPTVVAHEYGHSIHDMLDRPPQSKFREAVGYAVSTFRMDDPREAPDYCANGQVPHLQNLATTTQQLYCDDSNVSPHVCGEALGRAMWDMRQNLINDPQVTDGAAVADRLLASFLLISDGQLDQSALVEILAGDSDADGVLCSGTDHSSQILSAFTDRGFVDPCCDVADSVAVKWVGPLPPFEEPAIGTDYFPYNVVDVDVYAVGVCAPEIHLKTTFKDPDAVQLWRVGRADAGNIRAIVSTQGEWDIVNDVFRNIPIEVGNVAGGQAPCNDVTIVHLEPQDGGTWTNVALKTTGDLTLAARPFAASSGAGGRIVGDVTGSARGIEAAAIGSGDASAGTLDVGSLGCTAQLAEDPNDPTGELPPVQVCNDAAIQLSKLEENAVIVVAATNSLGGHIEVGGDLGGDIAVDDDIRSPIHIGGNVTGSIRAEMNGQTPVGSILATPNWPAETVTIDGTFDGDICAANLIDENGLPVDPLPNVSVGSFGDNATVCGESVLCGVALADDSGIEKNRYISVQPAAPPGSELAIRVTLTTMDGFGSFNGAVRWVGPPTQHPDEGVGTFTAAELLCVEQGTVPHVQDWSEVGLLHIYGAAVVPDSEYLVEIVDVLDGEHTVACQSSPLPVTTAKWGDIVEGFFVPGGPAQPDFSDISALVDKFTASPTAPIKARAQLQPNVPKPGDAINFTDIANCIDAFTGAPYPHAGPVACPGSDPTSPPPEAPPAFVCQAAPCVTQADCPGGCCYFEGPTAADKYCRDAAERCAAQ